MYRDGAGSAGKAPLLPRKYPLSCAIETHPILNLLSFCLSLSLSPCIWSRGSSLPPSSSPSLWPPSPWLPWDARRTGQRCSCCNGRHVWSEASRYPPPPHAPRHAPLPTSWFSRWNARAGRGAATFRHAPSSVPLAWWGSRTCPYGAHDAS